jgi:hypothetical protein
MFLHNLLNVLVQIANKMGLQTKHVKRCFLIGPLAREDKLGTVVLCWVRPYAIARDPTEKGGRRRSV